MKVLVGIGFGSVVIGVMWFGKVLFGLVNFINWVKGVFIVLCVVLIVIGIGVLVVGFVMVGVWIYNNWFGFKFFFKGFGEVFMKFLGFVCFLVEGVINVVCCLWDWIGKLLVFLDVSIE